MGTLRTFKYGSHASLYTVIVLAVIVLVYVMAARYNQTFDVTREGRFTLADQTRQLLQGLDQPVHIIGFFSTRSPRTGRFYRAAETLRTP